MSPFATPINNCMLNSWFGDLGEECIVERRLARACAAGNEHILAVAHRRAEELGLRRQHANMMPAST
jgi:hypothetical protein